MKTRRLSHIVMGVLAAFAAAVLFATYGTALPETPFSTIKLDGPVAADFDEELSVVVDAGSRRALILNAAGELTGVVICTTLDSPFDAITDARAFGELVYLSGASFAPDSDVVERERVAVYDKGGNLRGIVADVEGSGKTLPSIKSLNKSPEGVVIARQVAVVGDEERATGGQDEGESGFDIASERNEVLFELIAADGLHGLHAVEADFNGAHDAAFSTDGAHRCVVLNMLGILDDSASKYGSQIYAGHVYTSIDIDDRGTLYAYDDEMGALCAIAPGSSEARVLVSGEGYGNVHANGDGISLCNVRANEAMRIDALGNVESRFSEVTPSVGFSARMALVWVSGLYLLALALVVALRKLYSLVKEGRTEHFGPMLLVVAVVSAVSVAVASLSFSSYQSAIEQRANEVNMCADYLVASAHTLSEPMEKIGGRDVLREDGDKVSDSFLSYFDAIVPVHSLINSANDNAIGMYYNMYGKDDRGIFYLNGSASEYVAGTSAELADDGELASAFAQPFEDTRGLILGRTLRDQTIYRLIAIPSSDWNGVVGVIEVGSKMQSFESSLAASMAERILALLVVVLVVYLAYSELRACGKSLIAYRKLQSQDAIGATALLTRPFTLSITMLTSVDSVMTVLIARDLLERIGAQEQSALLALPAVMLGIGLVIGQGLYGLCGSRVGLRRLMVGGALAMLLCACLTGAAVAFGGFWLYCAAKLALSIPFGMLYSLGYSLPRMARDDDVRVEAAGGVRRTDTSAAALGTVIGGYAAQMLGNSWVYVLVALASILVVVMALNLLPRGMAPLERLAQPDRLDGHFRDLIKTPTAPAIAFFILLPATVAAGYASFLFPIFSADLGLQKSHINNIVVVGQLVVYVCINMIDRIEARRGKWLVSMASVALLGAVFLLFSVNTTLVWSFAVIAIVALLCKSADGYKALWLQTAGEAGVPAGRATSAMFATRSVALIAQPFILGALLGATDSFAVIAIGVFCLLCAALFFLVTRRTSLR